MAVTMGSMNERVVHGHRARRSSSTWTLRAPGSGLATMMPSTAAMTARSTLAGHWHGTSSGRGQPSGARSCEARKPYSDMSPYEGAGS